MRRLACLVARGRWLVRNRFDRVPGRGPQSERGILFHSERRRHALFGRVHRPVRARRRPHSHLAVDLRRRDTELHLIHTTASGIAPSQPTP